MRRVIARIVMAAIAAVLVIRSDESVDTMMLARDTIATMTATVCINGSVLTLQSTLYSMTICLRSPSIKVGSDKPFKSNQGRQKPLSDNMILRL